MRQEKKFGWRDPSPSGDSECCGAEKVGPGLGAQFTLALDRKVEAASPSLCRLIGCREDEIVGRSVLSVVHPEDMEALVLRLEALARDIDPGLMRPIRFFSRDGHTIWIDASLSVVRDRNDCPSCIVLTAMNATTQCSCATARSTQRCADGLLVSA
jgi:PAS domain S-box-containing protein